MAQPALASLASIRTRACCSGVVAISLPFNIPNGQATRARTASIGEPTQQKLALRVVKSPRHRHPHPLLHRPPRGPLDLDGVAGLVDPAVAEADGGVGAGHEAPHHVEGGAAVV